MSENVAAAFNNFNANFVNLDPDRTAIARSSRDWLLDQLVSLPSKFSDFPVLYENMHVQFGSFSRRTKIRELDDIDLILCFSAQGTKYTTIVQGTQYVLRPPEEAKTLRTRCNDDGTLNSIKMVNMLVSALREVEHYKQSETRRAQEAATLQLVSYEWCFDIVPAFYTDTGHYQIPDGSGGWKMTDPRIDQERITRINQKFDGKILQIIRTLKYWNRRAMMKTIPPYLFETMILNYFDAQTEVTDYIDFSLRSFWNHLRTGIHYSVHDPKGFQGDLNTLTFEERQGISEKAFDAYRKANEAITLETNEQDQPGAIRKWAEIFGPDFK